MITANELKRRLNVINAYWDIMKKHAKSKGSETDCESLMTDIQKVYENDDKSKFSAELGKTFANEIERIMMVNKKEGKENE